VRDDMAVRTWEDLNRPDVTIAVPQGSVMETNVRRFMPRATVLSFPNNPETIAAFQSNRANAASLFAPALTALHARLRRGRIVIPTPTRVAVSQVAVRREADKTLRDWLDLCTAYYYNVNQTQVWYEEFLRTRNVDPAAVPAIRRELWPT
jgi:polar amino acid transport system substrate-binding protein